MYLSLKLFFLVGKQVALDADVLRRAASIFGRQAVDSEHSHDQLLTLYIEFEFENELATTHHLSPSCRCCVCIVNRPLFV